MAVTITGQISGGLSATLSQPVAGVQGGVKSPPMAMSPSKSFGTAAANAAVGGADTMYGPTLLSIGTSATTTLTLSAGTLKDNLGNAITITAGHIKSLTVWVLSTTQTSPDGTAGTACSGVTVQGDCLVGAGRPNITAASKFEVLNGCSITWDFDNGTGYTVATGASDVITVINEDASNVAKVMIAIELCTT